jgi:hypothetical protein
MKPHILASAANPRRWWLCWTSCRPGDEIECVIEVRQLRAGPAPGRAWQQNGPRVEPLLRIMVSALH